MKVKGGMIMLEIRVPDEYRYVLDRGVFEYIRSAQNLAFMLNKHLGDNNTDFLTSDLYKRLRERVNEAYVQQLSYTNAIAYKLIVEDRQLDLPKVFSYANENRILIY